MNVPAPALRLYAPVAPFAVRPPHRALQWQRTKPDEVLAILTAIVTKPTRRLMLQVAAANRDTPEERDARIEYLSWRVWAMKRKKAALAAAAARRAAAAAAAGEDEYIGDYDDSDDRTVPLTHPMLYMDDLDANALEVRKGRAGGAAGDVGQGWWAEVGVVWCGGCVLERTEDVGRAEVAEEHKAQGAVQFRRCGSGAAMHNPSASRSTDARVCVCTTHLWILQQCRRRAPRHTANAPLQPLTEEADHDPSSLLLEPLSGDQASVPDTDTAVDQSWDAVYPATAAAKAAAKEAAAKEAAGGGGQQVGRRTSTGSGSGGGSPFHKPATPSQTDVASALGGLARNEGDFTANCCCFIGHCVGVRDCGLLRLVEGCPSSEYLSPGPPPPAPTPLPSPQPPPSNRPLSPPQTTPAAPSRPPPSSPPPPPRSLPSPPLPPPPPALHPPSPPLQPAPRPPSLPPAPPPPRWRLPPRRTWICCWAAPACPDCTWCSSRCTAWCAAPRWSWAATRTREDRCGTARAPRTPDQLLTDCSLLPDALRCVPINLCDCVQ